MAAVMFCGRHQHLNTITVATACTVVQSDMNSVAVDTIGLDVAPTSIALEDFAQAGVAGKVLVAPRTLLHTLGLNSYWRLTYGRI